MIGNDLGAARFYSLSFSQIMSFSGRGRGARPAPTGPAIRIHPNPASPPEMTAQDVGALAQFAGRTGEDGTALDEDDAAVGERVDRRMVLVDDDDRNSSLADAADHPPDLAADERRQPLGRLVEDDQLRIGHQGPADRQHLLLAAGELAAA